MTALLESLGYDVMTASDGRQGLEVFESSRGRIDGVLLDIVMPEMGGVECARALRRLAPHLPIVISSGFGGDSMGMHEIEGPYTVFVRKPYRVEELANAMARLLCRS